MTVLVALLAGGLVFAATLLVLTTRRRAAVNRRVEWYSGPSKKRRTAAFAGSRPNASDHLETMLDRFGATDRVQKRLERAGVGRSPGAFVGLIVVVALAALALGTIVRSFELGVLAAIAVPFITAVVLSARAARRSKAFEAQLPEILDSLSSSLRAGHGFDYALQAMADDVGEPAGAEFRRVVAETHLGRPMDVALRELGERVESKDLLFVLDAIMVQRQVGGSLAELFELVSETVRSREQFRRKLRASTGMVRLSAKMLMGIPIAIGILLTLVNRPYMEPLFTTRAGLIMLSVAAGMMVFGGLMLRRIGQVKP